VVAITDDSDERALIEAAQADPARFLDVYECHFHRVYAYVIRRTLSRAEAEEERKRLLDSRRRHSTSTCRMSTRCLRGR